MKLSKRERERERERVNKKSKMIASIITVFGLCYFLKKNSAQKISKELEYFGEIICIFLVIIQIIQISQVRI